jgi:hypothetical protein
MWIKVKDKNLYNQWIDFLCKKYGCKENATIRTEAFFKTQKLEKPIVFI